MNENRCVTLLTLRMRVLMAGLLLGGVLIAILGFAYVSFIRPGNGTPVQLPLTSEIKSLDVSGIDRASRPTHAITDPEKIKHFVNFVHGKNRRWKQTWHTFPTGDHSVVVNQGDEVAAIFWLGHTWIGVRDESSHPERLCSLSVAEWQQLTRILELPVNAHAR